MALVGTIFAGGAALAIIQAVSPAAPRTAAASNAAAPGLASTARAPHRQAPEPPPPPPPAELRARAIELLEGQLESPSPRVRRIAALALARTGAPRALKVLDGLLDDETSQLRRMEIAYGLARAGQERGKSELLAGLRAKRRDVRLDAAAALAHLGNDAGVRQLHAMLAIRTHRLGAAAVLAELGDDEGVRVLAEAANDERDSPETRMRAVVALGRAGRPEARARLHEILDAGTYQVGAALALAALSDDSAVPALERQLEHASVRVRAAEALASLGATVDLEPLHVALDSGDDVAEVSAAEALIILVPDSSGAQSEADR